MLEKSVWTIHRFAVCEVSFHSVCVARVGSRYIYRDFFSIRLRYKTVYLCWGGKTWNWTVFVVRNKHNWGHWSPGKSGWQTSLVSIVAKVVSEWQAAGESRLPPHHTTPYHTIIPQPHRNHTLQSVTRICEVRSGVPRHALPGAHTSGSGSASVSGVSRLSVASARWCPVPRLWINRCSRETWQESTDDPDSKVDRVCCCCLLSPLEYRLIWFRCTAGWIFSKWSARWCSHTPPIWWVMKHQTI